MATISFCFPLLIVIYVLLISFVTAPNVMNVYNEKNLDKKQIAKSFVLKEALPQQIHISIGDTATEIVVMWATLKEDESIVFYHTDATKSSPKEANGESAVFKENRKGFQHLHRVILKNLTPGVKYYYSVGGKSFRSELISFRVPNIYQPHTYMVYGDLGTHTVNLPYLVHEAKSRNYTAIFHIGDIAYDLGRDGGKVGDKFLNMIQDMSSTIPYMTIPGDHDLFQDEQYRYRFSHPNMKWPLQMDGLWYSFDIGKAHIIAISTEVFFTDVDNVENFLNWLHQDLSNANTNRGTYPWVLVMAHRPIYCSMDDKREDCRKSDSVVRRNLEDIYFKYGVDVVFSGHEHLYERTWPVYKNEALQYHYIEPKGPVQIITGSLGNQYLTEGASKAGGGWSAFRKSEMELEVYGQLTIYNHTHLLWEARSAMDNHLVDKMLLIQRVHGGFASEKVFIPDPLGAAGAAWRNQQKKNEEEGSLVNLNFYLFYDDYNTKLTVLISTLVILIIGIIFRKRVLNTFRICCLKKEPGNGNMFVK